MKFDAERSSGGVEALQADRDGTVLGVALPDDGEVAVGVGCNGGGRLIRIDIRIDDDLLTFRSAARPESLHQDPPPGGFLTEPLPSDHESSVGEHRDRRVRLRPRVIVHPKFGSHRRSRGTVELPFNVLSLGAEETVPDDDELAGGAHGDGRIQLIVNGCGVHAELCADGGP